MKRTIIKLVIAVILTGVMYIPVSKAVVVVAATNAAVAANNAAQTAARNAQIAAQQAQRIDFPKDKEPDAQYGFVTCGKRTGEQARNFGCAVDVNDSAFTEEIVETPYRNWPRKILGIENYTVVSVQFDHYNAITTVYFEYR